MRLDSSLNTSDGSGTGLLRSVGAPVHERSEVSDSFGLVKAKIVVQEEEQLFLHEVNLGRIEQLGEASPVLVLRRRVVEVLGGHYQRREEHAVARARHACARRQRRRQGEKTRKRG